MKKRKFAVLLMIFILCLSGFRSMITVWAEQYSIDVTGGASKLYDAKPGEKLHMKLPIRANIGFISNPLVTVNPAANAPMNTSKVTFTRENTQGDVNFITSYDDTYLEFDIEVKETAKIGMYDLTVTFEFDDLFDPGVLVSTSFKIVIRIATEKEPAQLAIDKVEYSVDDAVIGNTFDVVFTIKNEGEITALNTYFSLDFASTGMSPAYTIDSHKLGDLKGGQKTKITLPVTILPTAEEGFKTLSANFTYKDLEGTVGSDTRNLYITVQKTNDVASDKAKLVITGDGYQKDIDPGTEFELAALIENVGAQGATNIRVSLADGIGTATGILPNFTSSDIVVSDMVSGATNKVNIPLIVTSSATPGLHEIIVQVTYLDNEDVSHTSVTKIYLMVNKPEEEDEEKIILGLDFNDVSQSPSRPVVGGKVYASFTVTNTGSDEISNLRLWAEGLSSTGFEPVNSDPYHKIGTLAVGEKKQITMTFTVGAMINEGMNDLSIGYSYDDIDNNSQTGNVTIHILNVKNDNNSKPKLVVADYSTDTNELKAGSNFNFTFSLKNMHISKAAKNITVIITSTNDVFSAVMGSSNFYIDKIEPGGVFEKTLEMKVKADVATGGYELEIAVEYEYDNMSAADEEKGGVTDKTTIKLQAVENARPVVQDIDVYNWYTNGPIVNQSANIAFSFYNMGRSALNNVYFTLEGDFALEMGTMQFYGSAAAGLSDYVDYPVIPLKEGMCEGKVIIHYEDSNGNEVTKEQEFSGIFVQAEPMTDSFDPGFDGSWPAGTDPINAPKEPIVKLWLFLVIQAAIVVIVIPSTRAIGIKLHKRKLMKSEES